MLKNPMKQLLKEGGIAVGPWMDLAEPALVEIAGYIGYDFVILEHEHAARSLSQLEQLIRAADVAQIPTIVRIKENTDSLIQQVLDAGAMGVLIALTRTKEDAIKAVRAAKFPPLGVRGAEPWIRSTKFGGYGISYAEYVKEMNEQITVSALVENQEGVDNVADIASVDGLDGLYYGLWDHALELGMVDQCDKPPPTLLAARDKVNEASKSQGKWVWGYVPDPADVAEQVKMGVNVLTVPHDSKMIWDCHKEWLKKVRAEIGRI